MNIVNNQFNRNCKKQQEINNFINNFHNFMKSI